MKGLNNTLLAFLLKGGFKYKRKFMIKMHLLSILRTLLEFVFIILIILSYDKIKMLIQIFILQVLLFKLLTKV